MCLSMSINWDRDDFVISKKRCYPQYLISGFKPVVFSHVLVFPYRILLMILGEISTEILGVNFSLYPKYILLSGQDPTSLIKIM